MLDIFLQRNLQLVSFEQSWGLLQHLQREAKVTLESLKQPALFGKTPQTTLLDAMHGSLGILSISNVFLPADWKSLWRAAHALTCYSVAQPVGDLK